MALQGFSDARPVVGGHLWWESLCGISEAERGLGIWGWAAPWPGHFRQSQLWVENAEVSCHCRILPHIWLLHGCSPFLWTSQNFPHQGWVGNVKDPRLAPHKLKLYTHTRMCLFLVKHMHHSVDILTVFTASGADLNDCRSFSIYSSIWR